MQLRVHEYRVMLYEVIEHVERTLISYGMRKFSLKQELFSISKMVMCTGM